jgi:hypothetical protein
MEQLSARYVRCINNRAYVRHTSQPQPDYELVTLVVGQVYKVAPPDENDGDLLRVIDESGEDYLYPARYFEPLSIDDEETSETIATYVPAWLKGVLHAEAVAANISMSALVRTWLEERLDLPAKA